MFLHENAITYPWSLGDASAHASTNIPVILAGGGFAHPGHVALSREQSLPLSDLFLRMLHQFGVEVDAFGSSTGQLTGLD